MRAVAVRRFGESALMTDLPAPGAEDSVLIRVSYAGVNPVDWQLVDQLTPNSPFPFVLGVDVAGLAEHVPAQETRLHVGDRVFGMARTHGSYAEYTAVPTGGRQQSGGGWSSGQSGLHMHDIGLWERSRGSSCRSAAPQDGQGLGRTNVREPCWTDWIKPGKPAPASFVGRALGRALGMAFWGSLRFILNFRKVEMK